MKIILTLFVTMSGVGLGQNDKDNHEDNIAMESFSGKSLDQLDFREIAARFGQSSLNQDVFSSILSRAGELHKKVSGSNFGNRLGVARSKVGQSSIIKSHTLDQLSKDQMNGLTNLTEVKGRKKVDDIQDELKDLLFGEELTNQAVIEQNDAELNTTIVSDIKEKRMGDDILEYSDDNSLDYDAENPNRRMLDSEDQPLTAELRSQRRPGSGYRRVMRRRPYRGQSINKLGGFGENKLGGYGENKLIGYGSNRRNQRLPPVRAPEIHKVPGRIQSVPFNRDGGARKDKFNVQPFPASPPSQGVDCDFYTDDLCLSVDTYPRQEVVSLLGVNRRISDDMIADVTEQGADDLIDGVSSNQENTYTFDHYFGMEGNRREDTTHKHRDFAQDGGFLCPSEIKYAKPKRGKTAQGVWKDIVNVNDYTQTLRMEKCLQPGGSCSYVSHHYKSQCSQVYNYHRLLSWDEERGLHMDIYKVPTCCSCHIMGYSYIYPPLKDGKSKKDEGPRSPAISSSGQLNLPSKQPPKQSFSSPSNSLDSFLNPSHPTSNSQPPSRPQESFVSFGNPISEQKVPQQKPIQNFPTPRPEPDLDNFIPDFNPQHELESFINTIGDDFRDFNDFGAKRPPRRPVVPFGRPSRRPTPMGGFRPVSNLRAPPPRGRQPVRRGDGFGPGGKLINNNIRLKTKEKRQQESDMEEDPIHKYETIPLEVAMSNLVKKKGKPEKTDLTETPKSVNYGYHPIIDFFNPYKKF